MLHVKQTLVKLFYLPKAMAAIIIKFIDKLAYTNL